VCSSSFLISNKIGVKSILINPVLDFENIDIIDIKKFNNNFNIEFNNTCDVEIYFGDNDKLISYEVTKKYLKDNNIIYDGTIIKDLGHSCSPDELDKILNMSKFLT